jgi:hypothetical protein
VTNAYMPIGRAMEVLGLSRQRISVLIKDGRLNRFYIPGRRRGMVPCLLADDVYAYAAERQVAKPRRPKKPPQSPSWWDTPEGVIAGWHAAPVTDEDRIVAVLLLTGIVELADVFCVASRRRVARFEASGLGVREFINAGG